MIRVFICTRVNESSSSSSSNSFSERAAVATATATAAAAAAARERGGEEMMRDLLETNFAKSADKTIKQERQKTTTYHDVRNGRIRTLAATISGERIQRRPGASS